MIPAGPGPSKRHDHPHPNIHEEPRHLRRRELPWSRAAEALGTGAMGPETVCFLGTVRPDGRPHAAGIGVAYHDGDLWFTSGPDTRKSRDLAANPACTISIRLEGIDLVAEGEAHRVTDPEKSRRSPRSTATADGPHRRTATSSPPRTAPRAPARRRGTSTGCASRRSSASACASRTGRAAGDSERRWRGEHAIGETPRFPASERTPHMQLGMVGLGRMGANMVRRLQRAGHDCVAFDRHPENVQAVVDEGATGAASLEELVAKMDKPRAVWLMIPAAYVDGTLDAAAAAPGHRRRRHRRRQLLLPGRPQALGAPRRARDALRRLRHERRRLGPRARLLAHDRRRRRRRRPARADLRVAGARRGGGAAHARAARAISHPARRAGCTADRPARATS